MRLIRLPDLDRLANVVQLIYYDQAGRGRSAEGVLAKAVTMTSEVQDIERVRQHLGKKPVVLLGHSWGTVLALEYALRYPAHVSALILMNPAQPRRAMWLYCALLIWRSSVVRWRNSSVRSLVGRRINPEILRLLLHAIGFISRRHS